MRVRLFPCPSLRDLFYTVIFILTGSAVITYNVSRYLPSWAKSDVTSENPAAYLKLLPRQVPASERSEPDTGGQRVLEGIYQDGRSSEGGGGRSMKYLINIPSSQLAVDDHILTHSKSSKNELNRSEDFTKAIAANNQIQSTAEQFTETRVTNHDSTQLCESACNEEMTSLPLLQCIFTTPSLNMTPLFNATTLFEYYATVAHDVMLIQVHAPTQHCHVEVRVSNKNGPTGISNYTLGVGLNEIRLLLIYASTNSRTGTLPPPSAAAPAPCAAAGPAACVVNVYTLNVYRQHAGETHKDVDIQLTEHQMCYLRQDCGLRFLPGMPCGLQRSNHSSWTSYKSHRRKLKTCTSGTEAGDWLLPCGSCSNSSSCYWHEAQWQPYNCKHSQLSKSDLRICLAGKKILFIGDSTNRGIMHYLIEHANESLTEWDKTHDTKVYRNLNRLQTTVSFAYYPQFWLSADLRPMFDETLFQLIKMTQPLENSPRTVLVVGGVHWLAIQHLNTIAAMLKKEGLTGINVVVKTLGAGFHQPVDGLHHLTLVEQRRLVLHNAALVDHAVSLGFNVVETFNMTMARYADFLQGKCACHFHRIKEVLPSFSQYVRSSTRNGGRNKLSDMPIHYHVEGEINAAYSEIVFNQICSRGA